ncbi:hypothetical protein [Persephonella sp.]
MKIISIELSGEKKKGIVLKKKKNDLFQIVDYNINTDGTYYISVFYQDFISEKVTIPEVNDRETLNFLIKNKLSERLEPNKDYIFLPKKIKPTQDNLVEYNVYAIPEEVYTKAVEQLKIENQENIEVFTLSQFSLAGIGTETFKDKTVFVTFIDEEKIIITVSKNNEIIYTRSTLIPPYLNDESQLINFYYENFNLTYIYVSQNTGINIDIIGLVGEISQKDEFVNLISEFTGKSIYTVLPTGFFEKISYEDFNKYVIPLGNVLIGNDYNFIPPKIKEKKTFGSILSKLTMITGIIFIILTALNLNNLIKLKGEMRDLDRLFIEINENFERDVLGKEITHNQLKYIIYYLDLLDPEKRIIFKLDRIKNLLSLIDHESIKITNEKNKSRIVIKATQKFKTLQEFENFKRKVSLELMELSDLNPKNNTTFDINSLTAKVFIELYKEN